MKEKAGRCIAHSIGIDRPSTARVVSIWERNFFVSKYIFKSIPKLYANEIVK